MLRYSEFRRPVVEAETPVDVSKPNPLATELSRLVDDFVSRLKSQIVNSAPESRGVWDRVKNWWSNLWHGRTGQNNPYYWQNKLGDGMGRTVESVGIMPLEHYKVLREHAVMLEEMLPAGTEKLQIVRTIDAWAKDFKNAVVQLAYHHEPPVDAFPEMKPEPAPTPTPTPEAKPKPTPTPAPAPAPTPTPTPAPAPEAEPEPEPTEEDKWKKQALERLEKVQAKLSMSPARYGVLKDYIEIGERDRVEKFLDYFERRAMPPEEKPEAEKPEEKVPATAEIEHPEDVGKKPESDGPAPAGARSWRELNPHEQAEWDRWGGGISGDITDIAKLKHEIHTLPWILRIGDPRLKDIRSIRNGALYRRLAQEERIESHSHPIKDEIELERAVERAKTLHGENKKRHQEQGLDVSKRTRLRKALKRRLGRMSKIPKTNPQPKLPSDENPVPAPKTAEMELPGSAEKETTPEPTTAMMDLPGPTGEKLDVSDKISEFSDELEGMKGDLDEEMYEKLKKMISRLKDEPDKVDQVRANLDAVKKQNSDHDEDDSPDKWVIEHTIKDRTALLISNFRQLARR